MHVCMEIHYLLDYGCFFFIGIHYCNLITKKYEVLTFMLNIVFRRLRIGENDCS